MTTKSLRTAALMLALLAAPSAAIAQATTTDTSTAADRDTRRGFDYGWLGLLGLIGLGGLMKKDRRDDVRTDLNRTSRT